MTDDGAFVPAGVPEECPRCGDLLVGYTRVDYRDHIWHDHGDRLRAMIWFNMTVERD